VLPGTDGVLVQTSARMDSTADLRYNAPCETSRAKSWRLNRDRGKPVSAGSSQAKALTCTTTSGGKKTGRAPRPGFSLQASESFLEETVYATLLTI